MPDMRFVNAVSIISLESVIVADVCLKQKQKQKNPNVRLENGKQ